MPTALITGASAGLGVDFCHLMAERGYDLVMVARSQERMGSLAAAIEVKHGIRCKVIAMDLSAPGSAEDLYRRIEQQKTNVDVLINNAGFGVYGDLVNNPVKSFEEMLQLNIMTLASLTRLFLADMLKIGKGKILNVASTAAFQPGPHMAGYYASKAFVLSFSEAVSHELRGTGVSITTLCPGPTRTEFFDRAGIKQSRLKLMVMADSRTCAERGIVGMLSGSAIVIDGTKNWLIVQSLRFLPRFFVRSASAFISGQSR